MVSMVSVSTEHGLFIGISNNTIFHYDYDLDHIKAMIAPLGIPLAYNRKFSLWRVETASLMLVSNGILFEKLFISTKPN